MSNQAESSLMRVGFRCGADKDYRGECDILQALLGAPPRRLAEIGCGTGTHGLELARRGYEVVGLDASKPMLARAEAKRGADRTTRFVHGDMRETSLGTGFQALLSMFAALGYVTDNRDLERTLRSFRAHLAPGGLFLFDFWYGPAVLRQLPDKRSKRAGDERLTVVRTATPELDARRHVCVTHYELELRRAGAEPERFSESHAMRFFFPQEIELLVHGAGFTLEKLAPFPNVEGELDDSSWNAIALARAR